jgi:hypothetical protein
VSRKLQLAVTILLSWILSPMSFLPTLIFAVMLEKVSFDLVRHKTAGSSGNLSLLKRKVLPNCLSTLSFSMTYIWYENCC